METWKAYGLLLGIISLILWWLYRKNRIILTDQELLEFISYDHWKSGGRIRREIEARYRGGWFGYACIYTRLMQLESDGSIERRMRLAQFIGQEIVVHEFKKKRGVVPCKNQRLLIRSSPVFVRTISKNPA